MTTSAVTFNLSQFGRSVVTAEGFQTLPTIRLIFCILTAVLGIVANVHVLYTFIALRRQLHNRTPVRILPSSPSVCLIVAAVIAYLCNQAIHSAHYVDNIYRPVAYLEPEWLYKRYVFSTMEITFFFNFPLTIGGTWCITRMFGVENGRLSVTGQSKHLRGLILYVLGSWVTLGHYRQAPPSAYSAVVNFTIAGEGVAAALLLILVVLCWRQRNENMGNERGNQAIGQKDGKEYFLLEQHDDDELDDDGQEREVHRRSPFKSDDL